MSLRRFHLSDYIWGQTVRTYVTNDSMSDLSMILSLMEWAFLLKRVRVSRGIRHVSLLCLVQIIHVLLRLFFSSRLLRWVDLPSAPLVHHERYQSLFLHVVQYREPWVLYRVVRNEWYFYCLQKSHLQIILWYPVEKNTPQMCKIYDYRECH